MLKNLCKAMALVIFIAQLNAFAALQTTTRNPSDKQPPIQDKPFRLRTEEVIVDTIVVDKKNRAVSDLNADDFEVYEDGVKQKITSFRFESNSEAAESSSAKANRAASGELRTPNLVSLVFDAQTTRDGALRARRAALDYIDSGMGPNDYVAVFGIDLGLMILSPYTNDKVGIKQAIEAFTSRESKKYLAVANEVREKLEGLVEPLSNGQRLALIDSTADIDTLFQPPSQLGEDVKTDPSGFSSYQLMLSAINLTGLRVLRTFERYEREYQGWRSVGALLAIISGQKSVRAGRKTLMLFSEGFAVSPSVQQQYLSVISAANKSGVTIYSFDIAGLRIINPNEQMMQEREAAAAARIRNPNPELVSGGVSSIGRSEEIARLNTVTTLDEISEETGGYAVKNTNDLTEGLKRILDELGNHYVMTYMPTNQSNKGEFRRITVKLNRPGDFRIRSRRGYYALRSLDESPVLAHEIPLLERANAASLVRDFPLYAQALHFRGTSAARVVALYVEFPVSALKFETDQKAKTFTSRFALLALVKNSSNEIVRKLGQEFVLKGPLPQLEEIKKRPQIYHRLILLPPGSYTLEAIARDSSTEKASVSRTSFEVPSASEDALAISSLVLSRGLNPLTEEQKKKSHPLYLEGQAYFVPNIEQTFSLSREKNILVHFSVYTRSKVNATVVFLKDGSVITQAGGALPEPDATGRIAYATSFPTEHFQPGEYDLKITVTDGSHRSTSTTHFKIEP
jgi:VWFA-related protein